MTATATITATERRGVLLVPNAALRFTPLADGAAATPGNSGGIVSRLIPRAPRTGGVRRAGTTPAGAREVWVLREGAPVSVAVKPGASDGRRTEVVGDGLREGDPVITDQITDTAQ